MSNERLWERDDHPYRETGRAMPLLAVWVLCIMLLVVLGTAGWLGYQKFYVNQQTQITRQTIQYQTSAQTHLIDLMRDYENPQATAGQRDVILVEMRKQVAVMNPGDVPVEVRAFMASH